MPSSVAWKMVCIVTDTIFFSLQCSWQAATGFPSMAWPAYRLSSSPQPLGRNTYLWHTPATTFLTSLNIAAKRLWRLDWPRPSTIMRVLVWPEAPQDILPFLSGHIAADTKYHGERFLFFYCLSGLRLLNPKSQSMCFLGSVVNSLFEKSVVGDRPKNWL